MKLSCLTPEQASWLESLPWGTNKPYLLKPHATAYQHHPLLPPFPPSLLLPQMAVMGAAEYSRMVEVAAWPLHTLHEVPDEAFPLFVTSKQWLRLLDGTVARPFFPRAPSGAVIQVGAQLPGPS